MDKRRTFQKWWYKKKVLINNDDTFITQIPSLSQSVGIKIIDRIFWYFIDLIVCFHSFFFSISSTIKDSILILFIISFLLEPFFTIEEHKTSLTILFHRYSTDVIITKNVCWCYIADWHMLIKYDVYEQSLLYYAPKCRTFLPSV